MKTILIALLMLVGIIQGPDWAFASGYYKPYYYCKGNTIYYRTYYPKQCYYGSQCYTTYVYRDRYVTDSSKSDWKETYLRVVNQIKQNEAFYQAAALLLPQQSFQQPAYAQQAPALYPQQTGKTVGGFSSYYGAQYGAVASVDANAALKQQFAAVDNVTRMATELGQMSNQVAVQAVAVTNLNGERVGAIAELQEYRAALKERESALAMRERMQNEFLLAIKPQPSSQFQGQQQGASYQSGGYSEPPPHPAPPGNGGGYQSPQQPPGGPTPLFNQFCGACHGSQASSPGGGWAWNGQAFDRYAWGDIYLRIDPNTPELTSDGKPMRMPPTTATQPNDDQRRQLVMELRQYVNLQ